MERNQSGKRSRSPDEVGSTSSKESSRSTSKDSQRTSANQKEKESEKSKQSHSRSSKSDSSASTSSKSHHKSSSKEKDEKSTTSSKTAEDSEKRSSGHRSSSKEESKSSKHKTEDTKHDDSKSSHRSSKDKSESSSKHSHRSSMKEDGKSSSSKHDHKSSTSDHKHSSSSSKPVTDPSSKSRHGDSSSSAADKDSLKKSGDSSRSSKSSRSHSSHKENESYGGESSKGHEHSKSLSSTDSKDKGSSTSSKHSHRSTSKSDKSRSDKDKDKYHKDSKKSSSDSHKKEKSCTTSASTDVKEDIEDAKRHSKSSSSSKDHTGDFKSSSHPHDKDRSKVKKDGESTSESSGRSECKSLRDNGERLSSGKKLSSSTKSETETDKISQVGEGIKSSKDTEHHERSSSAEMPIECSTPSVPSSSIISLYSQRSEKLSSHPETKSTDLHPSDNAKMKKARARSPSPTAGDQTSKYKRSKLDVPEKHIRQQVGQDDSAKKDKTQSGPIAPEAGVKSDLYVSVKLSSIKRGAAGEKFQVEGVASDGHTSHPHPLKRNVHFGGVQKFYIERKKKVRFSKVVATYKWPMSKKVKFVKLKKSMDGVNSIKSGKIKKGKVGHKKESRKVDGKQKKRKTIAAKTKENTQKNKKIKPIDTKSKSAKDTLPDSKIGAKSAKVLKSRENIQKIKPPSIQKNATTVPPDASKGITTSSVQRKSTIAGKKLKSKPCKENILPKGHKNLKTDKSEKTKAAKKVKKKDRNVVKTSAKKHVKTKLTQGKAKPKILNTGKPIRKQKESLMQKIPSTLKIKRLKVAVLRQFQKKRIYLIEIKNLSKIVKIERTIRSLTRGVNQSTRPRDLSKIEKEIKRLIKIKQALLKMNKSLQTPLKKRAAKKKKHDKKKSSSKVSIKKLSTPKKGTEKAKATQKVVSKTSNKNKPKTGDKNKSKTVSKNKSKTDNTSSKTDKKSKTNNTSSKSDKKSKTDNTSKPDNKKSKTDNMTSKTDDKTSKTDDKTSKTKDKTSKTGDKTSKTGDKNSKTYDKTSKTDDKTSKSDSRASKTDKNSKTDNKTSKTDKTKSKTGNTNKSKTSSTNQKPVQPISKPEKTSQRSRRTTSTTKSKGDIKTSSENKAIMTVEGKPLSKDPRKKLIPEKISAAKQKTDKKRNSLKSSSSKAKKAKDMKQRKPKSASVRKKRKLKVTGSKYRKSKRTSKEIKRYIRKLHENLYKVKNKTITASKKVRKSSRSERKMKNKKAHVQNISSKIKQMKSVLKQYRNAKMLGRKQLLNFAIEKKLCPFSVRKKSSRSINFKCLLLAKNYMKHKNLDCAHFRMIHDTQNVSVVKSHWGQILHLKNEEKPCSIKKAKPLKRLKSGYMERFKNVTNAKISELKTTNRSMEPFHLQAENIFPRKFKQCTVISATRSNGFGYFYCPEPSFTKIMKWVRKSGHLVKMQLTLARRNTNVSRQVRHKSQRKTSCSSFRRKNICFEHLKLPPGQKSTLGIVRTPCLQSKNAKRSTLSSAAKGKVPHSKLTQKSTPKRTHVSGSPQTPGNKSKPTGKKIVFQSKLLQALSKFYKSKSAKRKDSTSKSKRTTVLKKTVAPSKRRVLYQKSSLSGQPSQKKLISSHKLDNRKRKSFRNAKCSNRIKSPSYKAFLQKIALPFQRPRYYVFKKPIVLPKRQWILRKKTILGRTRVFLVRKCLPRSKSKWIILKPTSSNLKARLVLRKDLEKSKLGKTLERNKIAKFKANRLKKMYKNSRLVTSIRKKASIGKKQRVLVTKTAPRDVLRRKKVLLQQKKPRILIKKRREPGGKTRVIIYREAGPRRKEEVLRNKVFAPGLEPKIFVQKTVSRGEKPRIILTATKSNQHELLRFPTEQKFFENKKETYNVLSIPTIRKELNSGKIFRVTSSSNSSFSSALEPKLFLLKGSHSLQQPSVILKHESNIKNSVQYFVKRESLMGKKSTFVVTQGSKSKVVVIKRLIPGREPEILMKKVLVATIRSQVAVADCVRRIETARRQQTSKLPKLPAKPSKIVKICTSGSPPPLLITGQSIGSGKRPQVLIRKEFVEKFKPEVTVRKSKFLGQQPQIVIKRHVQKQSNLIKKCKRRMKKLASAKKLLCNKYFDKRNKAAKIFDKSIGKWISVFRSRKLLFCKRKSYAAVLKRMEDKKKVGRPTFKIFAGRSRVVIKNPLKERKRLANKKRRAGGKTALHSKSLKSLKIYKKFGQFKNTKALRGFSYRLPSIRVRNIGKRGKKPKLLISRNLVPGINQSVRVIIKQRQPGQKPQIIIKRIRRRSGKKLQRSRNHKKRNQAKPLLHLASASHGKSMTLVSDPTRRLRLSNDFKKPESRLRGSKRQVISSVDAKLHLHKSKLNSLQQTSTRQSSSSKRHSAPSKPHSHSRMSKSGADKTVKLLSNQQKREIPKGFKLSAVKKSTAHSQQAPSFEKVNSAKRKLSPMSQTQEKQNKGIKRRRIGNKPQALKKPLKRINNPMERSNTKLRGKSSSKLKENGKNTTKGTGSCKPKSKKANKKFEKEFPNLLNTVAGKLSTVLQCISRYGTSRKSGAKLSKSVFKVPKVPPPRKGVHAKTNSHGQTISDTYIAPSVTSLSDISKLTTKSSEKKTHAKKPSEESSEDKRWPVFEESCDEQPFTLVGRPLDLGLNEKQPLSRDNIPASIARWGMIGSALPKEPNSDSSSEVSNEQSSFQNNTLYATGATDSDIGTSNSPLSTNRFTDSEKDQLAEDIRAGFPDEPFLRYSNRPKSPSEPIPAIWAVPPKHNFKKTTVGSILEKIARKNALRTEISAMDTTGAIEEPERDDNRPIIINESPISEEEYSREINEGSFVTDGLNSLLQRHPISDILKGRRFTVKATDKNKPGKESVKVSAKGKPKLSHLSSKQAHGVSKVNLQKSSPSVKQSSLPRQEALLNSAASPDVVEIDPIEDFFMDSDLLPSKDSNRIIFKKDPFFPPKVPETDIFLESSNKFVSQFEKLCEMSASKRPTTEVSNVYRQIPLPPVLVRHKITNFQKSVHKFKQNKVMRIVTFARKRAQKLAARSKVILRKACKRLQKSKPKSISSVKSKSSRKNIKKPKINKEKKSKPKSSAKSVRSKTKKVTVSRKKKVEPIKKKKVSAHSQAASSKSKEVSKLKSILKKPSFGMKSIRKPTPLRELPKGFVLKSILKKRKTEPSHPGAARETSSEVIVLAVKSAKKKVVISSIISPIPSNIDKKRCKHFKSLKGSKRHKSSSSSNYKGSSGTSHSSSKQMGTGHSKHSSIAGCSKDFTSPLPRVQATSTVFKVPAIPPPSKSRTEPQQASSTYIAPQVHQSSDISLAGILSDSFKIPVSLSSPKHSGTKRPHSQSSSSSSSSSKRKKDSPSPHAHAESSTPVASPGQNANYSGLTLAALLKSSEFPASKGQTTFKPLQFDLASRIPTPVSTSSQSDIKSNADSSAKKSGSHSEPDGVKSISQAQSGGKAPEEKRISVPTKAQLKQVSQLPPTEVETVKTTAVDTRKTVSTSKKDKPVDIKGGTKEVKKKVKDKQQSALKSEKLQQGVKAPSLSKPKKSKKVTKTSTTTLTHKSVVKAKKLKQVRKSKKVILKKTAKLIKKKRRYCSKKKRKRNLVKFSAKIEQIRKKIKSISKPARIIAAKKILLAKKLLRKQKLRVMKEEQKGPRFTVRYQRKKAPSLSRNRLRVLTSLYCKYEQSIQKIGGSQKNQMRLIERQSILHQKCPKLLQELRYNNKIQKSQRFNNKLGLSHQKYYDGTRKIVLKSLPSKQKPKTIDKSLVQKVSQKYTKRRRIGKSVLKMKRKADKLKSAIKTRKLLPKIHKRKESLKMKPKRAKLSGQSKTGTKLQSREKKLRKNTKKTSTDTLKKKTPKVVSSKSSKQKSKEPSKRTKKSPNKLSGRPKLSPVDSKTKKRTSRSKDVDKLKPKNVNEKKLVDIKHKKKTKSILPKSRTIKKAKKSINSRRHKEQREKVRLLQNNGQLMVIPSEKELPLTTMIVPKGRAMKSSFQISKPYIIVPPKKMKVLNKVKKIIKNVESMGQIEDWLSFMVTTYKTPPLRTVKRKTQLVSRISSNPYIVHSIQLQKHKRELQDRITDLKEKGVAMKISVMPKLPSGPKGFVEEEATPMDLKSVQHAISQRLCLSIAHAGFTHSKLDAIEALSFGVQEFYKSFCRSLKETVHRATSHHSIGFPDAMDRILTDKGYGGVRGLEDYYNTEIIQRHKSLHNLAALKRIEYASILRNSIGLAAHIPITPDDFSPESEAALLGPSTETSITLIDPTSKTISKAALATLTQLPGDRLVRLPSKGILGLIYELETDVLKAPQTVLSHEVIRPRFLEFQEPMENPQKKLELLNVPIRLMKKRKEVEKPSTSKKEDEKEKGQREPPKVEPSKPNPQEGTIIGEALRLIRPASIFGHIVTNILSPVEQQMFMQWQKMVATLKQSVAQKQPVIPAPNPATSKPGPVALVAKPPQFSAEQTLFKKAMELKARLALTLRDPKMDQDARDNIIKNLDPRILQFLKMVEVARKVMQNFKILQATIKGNVPLDKLTLTQKMVAEMLKQRVLLQRHLLATSGQLPKTSSMSPKPSQHPQTSSTPPKSGQKPQTSSMPPKPGQHPQTSTTFGTTHSPALIPKQVAANIKQGPAVNVRNRPIKVDVQNSTPGVVGNQVTNQNVPPFTKGQTKSVPLTKTTIPNADEKPRLEETKKLDAKPSSSRGEEGKKVTGETEKLDSSKQSQQKSGVKDSKSVSKRSKGKMSRYNRNTKAGKELRRLKLFLRISNFIKRLPKKTRVTALSRNPHLLRVLGYKSNLAKIIQKDPRLGKLIKRPYKRKTIFDRKTQMAKRVMLKKNRIHVFDRTAKKSKVVTLKKNQWKSRISESTTRKITTLKRNQGICTNPLTAGRRIVTVDTEQVRIVDITRNRMKIILPNSNEEKIAFMSKGTTTKSKTKVLKRNQIRIRDVTASNSKTISLERASSARTTDTILKASSNLVTVLDPKTLQKKTISLAPNKVAVIDPKTKKVRIQNLNKNQVKVLNPVTKSIQIISLKPNQIKSWDEKTKTIRIKTLNENQVKVLDPITKKIKVLNLKPNQVKVVNPITKKVSIVNVDRLEAVHSNSCNVSISTVKTGLGDARKDNNNTKPTTEGTSKSPAPTVFTVPPIKVPLSQLTTSGLMKSSPFLDRSPFHSTLQTNKTSTAAKSRKETKKNIPEKPIKTNKSKTGQSLQISPKVSSELKLSSYFTSHKPNIPVVHKIPSTSLSASKSDFAIRKSLVETTVKASVQFPATASLLRPVNPNLPQLSKSSKIHISIPSSSQVGIQIPRDLTPGAKKLKLDTPMTVQTSHRPHHLKSDSVSPKHSTKLPHVIKHQYGRPKASIPVSTQGQLQRPGVYSQDSALHVKVGTKLPGTPVQPLQSAARAPVVTSPQPLKVAYRAPQMKFPSMTPPSSLTIIPGEHAVVYGTSQPMSISPTKIAYSSSSIPGRPIIVPASATSVPSSSDISLTRDPRKSEKSPEKVSSSSAKASTRHSSDLTSSKDKSSKSSKSSSRTSESKSSRSSTKDKEKEKSSSSRSSESKSSTPSSSKSSSSTKHHTSKHSSSSSKGHRESSPVSKKSKHHKGHEVTSAETKQPAKRGRPPKRPASTPSPTSSPKKAKGSSRHSTPESADDPSSSRKHTKNH